MNLDRILLLIKNAQAGIVKEHTVYAATALDDAIKELKKVIEENDKMKVMGASATVAEKPQEEIVHIEPFILQSKNEKEFWEKCFVAALTCGCDNPNHLSDIAVYELRQRLDESDE